MHHLFTIPELLDWVLRMCERRCLTSCARVCRSWQTPSLRILWENAGIVPLLSLLGNFESSRQWKIGYKRSISVRGRDTFEVLPVYLHLTPETSSTSSKDS